MPAKAHHASGNSALSALVGRSMFLASPGSSDESTSRPRQTTISRETASTLVARRAEPLPAATDATTRTVLEAIFAKAGKVSDADPAHSPLVAKFDTAAIYSMLASIGSTILAFVIYQTTIWVFPSSNAVPTALLSFVGLLYLTHSKINKRLLLEAELSFRSRVWDMATSFLERPSALHATSEPETEAAHWLNDVLDSIWPFLNPDIFKPLINIAEATIQKNSPPFVSAVSIEDLGQGSKSFRIVGIRRLPKQPVDDEDDGPTSGEIFDDIMTLKPGLRLRRATELSTSSKRSTGRDLRERLKMLRERTSVHVEVAFDYDHTGDKHRHSDSKAMHLLVVFSLVGGIRLPVWINMERIVGKLRARVQLQPDPPFVSKGVVSLLGKPDIQFACLPLIKSGLNVMGLPLVAELVRHALDTALAAYISPRSITLDFGAILKGDTTSQDVYPFGVLIIKVHNVYDVESRWTERELSSFITVGLKSGDSLYIYRTIYNEKSPRWEETMVYSPGPWELNAQESLKICFCRVGSLENQQVLGSFKLLLADLLSTAENIGKMQRRVNDLIDEDHLHRVAKLEWSVGFFPKATVTLEQLQAQKIWPPINSHEEFNRRVDRVIKYKFREAPDSAKEEFEREKNAAMQEASLKIMNSLPPVEQYPCGILNVDLPMINFLSSTKAGRETDDSDETVFDDDIPGAPSSYATIYVNGHRVFRTITKPRNADPIYAASVFRFVRDWRTTEVVVVVRDKKKSKPPTFLGAIRINIAELFERTHSSRVHQKFLLEGGPGTGLVDMTILFRAITLDPPVAQKTWDYGTLQLNVPIVDEGNLLHEIKHAPLEIHSALEEWKLHSNHTAMPMPLIKDPDKLAWLPKDKHKTTITFPIKNKYAARLIFHWGHSATKMHWGHDRVSAYAFWKMEDVIEHEQTHVRVPVYPCHDKSISDSDLWPETHVDRKPMGYVEFSAVYWRGLTPAHARLMKSKDVDELMEVEQALGPNPRLNMSPV